MAYRQAAEMVENQRDVRSSSNGRALSWLAIGCLTLVTCLSCLVIAAGAGVIIGNRYSRSSGELLVSPADAAVTAQAPPLVPYSSPSPAPSPTAVTAPSVAEAQSTVAIITPTPAIQPSSEIRQDPPPASAFQHLAALLDAEYPARDYYENSYRLGRSEVGNRTVSAQAFQVGDRHNFITDDGSREAVLMAVTEHAYFWVESTLDYDPSMVEAAAQRFEGEFLPAVTKLYGSDWQAGVDDDPRFSALHLDGYADGSELGFFNSGDQYPRSINASSNEQEVVYLNMENMRPGEPLYFGTLVHELQHLIQWRDDPNEPVWLSEGLAQFTELYVGLNTVDTMPDYLSAPGTRLNTWLDDAGDEIFAHYGAAYLFVVYFWEQFGDQAIQALMQHPADGLAGINAVLEERAPQTSLDQFVLDWATANYVDDLAYGPTYSYEHLDLDTPEHSAEFRQSPSETMLDLEQFAVSYVDLDLRGRHTLTFAGDSVAELMPVDPRSGETMWFVPALNELDAQLTASFDLSDLEEAELRFWAWYDLEDDYDFAYVSVSADGGATWDLLMPTNVTAGEYGPALTGKSADLENNVDGWVEEAVSLAAYAGGPVLVRFEVLSDSAIAESGLAIDDIAIGELGFFDDVEAFNSIWQARGFVRTNNLVPQIWRLNLVQHGPTLQVTNLELNDRSQGEWTIDFGDQGATLVVTAQTPFVSNAASYWLAVSPAE